MSEHVWCEDYLVRSVYLKNTRTGETRTVTQFHFRSWPAQSVPASTKALLEFRRYLHFQNWCCKAHLDRIKMAWNKNSSRQMGFKMFFLHDYSIINQWAIHTTSYKRNIQPFRFTVFQIAIKKDRKNACKKRHLCWGSVELQYLKTMKMQIFCLEFVVGFWGIK